MLRTPVQSPPGLMRKTPAWLWVHGALSYVFLYMPIVVLVIYSFSASRSATVWSGFTTGWYGKLLQNERLMQAVGNSVVLAVTSTAIGAVLGTLAALGHARLRRGKRSAETALMLPLMVPDIVIALSVLLWFVKGIDPLLEWITGTTHLRYGMARMIAGHTVLSTCYVFMVVGARLRGFDWRLLEAARDLGAGGWQCFRHVQLPLLWPGVAGGALLSMAVSMDEYVITSFLSGPGNSTLPVEVAGMIKKSFTPELNALATLMLLSSVILALLAVFLQHRGPKKA